MAVPVPVPIENQTARVCRESRLPEHVTSRVFRLPAPITEQPWLDIMHASCAPAGFDA
jgi:hypothetical protein